VAVSEPPGAAGLLAELSGPPAGALGAGFEAAALPDEPDDPVADEPELSLAAEPELPSLPEEALSPVLGLELESPDEALGVVAPESAAPAEPPDPDVSAAAPPLGALPLSAPMVGPEPPGEGPPAPPICA
jgi:hypothetical protein